MLQVKLTLKGTAVATQNVDAQAGFNSDSIMIYFSKTEQVTKSVNSP